MAERQEELNSRDGEEEELSQDLETDKPVDENVPADDDNESEGQS